MVALKGQEIDRFVARPDPARPVVLVFGPDAGLVSERVNALVKASVDDPDDPFSLVRLDGEDVAANPGRLVEEAQTIPLFGGRRAVWVKAGTRNIASAVEELLMLPAGECRIVIEAGDLRRTSPLRALVERAKNAAALICYPDNDRDLEKLIDTEMRSAGLALADDARTMLVPLLGGDRAASRNELRKLTLYARGQGTVGVEDVAAIVSDASGLGTDDLIDAALAGRPAELETLLAKARLEGTSVGSILFAAQRHVAQMHKWRAALDDGALSMDRLLPPPNFKRKLRVETALRQWSAARLEAVMGELAAAVLVSRKMSNLDEAVAGRVLLSIAARARRRAA
jgi:DNA polymerase-3 subunit delta